MIPQFADIYECLQTDAGELSEETSATLSKRFEQCQTLVTSGNADTLDRETMCELLLDMLDTSSTVAFEIYSKQRIIKHLPFLIERAPQTVERCYQLLMVGKDDKRIVESTLRLLCATVGSIDNPTKFCEQEQGYRDNVIVPLRDYMWSLCEHTEFVSLVNGVFHARVDLFYPSSLACATVLLEKLAESTDASRRPAGLCLAMSNLPDPEQIVMVPEIGELLLVQLLKSYLNMTNDPGDRVMADAIQSLLLSIYRNLIKDDLVWNGKG
eukprot:TRINITY_DN4183_c0_g2_i1.p1 TRINITY_DN4183_c0_g2~~TRINITY_DN4183_c0_g2_i1.p1  ORF type:complete len:268 (+),score=78.05 TRINITY_DN4183_c0_g2_i1:427-1230(+)